MQARALEGRRPCPLPLLATHLVPEKLIQCTSAPRRCVVASKKLLEAVLQAWSRGMAGQGPAHG